MDFIQKLSGKKTQIIGLLLSALGTILALDVLLHGTLVWLTLEQYGAASLMLGGPGVLTMRAGIKKSEVAGKKAEDAAHGANQAFRAVVKELQNKQ